MLQSESAAVGWPRMGIDVHHKRSRENRSDIERDDTAGVIKVS